MKLTSSGILGGVAKSITRPSRVLKAADTRGRGLGRPDARGVTGRPRQRAICRAKVVKAEPAEIVVLSAGSLTLGERIVYASVADLEGFDLDQTPPTEKWRSGVIWRIDKNCLHLTRT